jgi:O-antigen polymerase
LILAGIVQTVYGSLQLYGVLPSRHVLFNSTGGFFNPGPFAGYLACVFCIALFFYINNPVFKTGFGTAKRVVIAHLYIENIINVNGLTRKVPAFTQLTKYMSLELAVSVLTLLPALRSRASWLAVLAVSGYIFYKRFGIGIAMATYINTWAKKLVVVFGVMVLLSVLVIGMYKFKKGSADGRLLIWKVSASLLAENPICGMGYEKFTSAYMNAQAQHFQQNPGSGFVRVADNTMYAFNDYLKIAVETGSFGLALALLVIFLVMCGKTEKNNNFEKKITTASRAGILSILIFALFSYPSDILPIKFNFIFLLAMVAKNSKELKCYKLAGPSRPILATSIILLLVLFLPIFVKWYESFLYWKNADRAYKSNLFEYSLKQFGNAMHMQQQNGIFLVNYGKALSISGKHIEAVEMLEHAQNYLTNSIVQTALGDSYRALGKCEKAEQAYMLAHNMVPGRFYPKYLLAKLYEETGQTEKAVETAREILGKEIKIESPAIEEIKSEMKKIIGQNN